MNLNHRNIIITGASSGIGLHLLNTLCKYDGVKIIAVARNVDKLPKLANKIFAYSADLSTPEGVDGLFEYAKNIFGHIDVFVANAGFTYIEELEKSDWKHIEAIFSLNVTSVIYSLEKFNEQAENHQRQFVCTISAVAFVPLHAYALYCSSKAALHQFVEAYRMEKRENLTLTAIYPVATKTAFFNQASGEENTPLPFPAQEVKHVVRKIVEGIERNKEKIYPSALFRFFYPIGRAFPFFLKMYSRMEKRKTKKFTFKR